MPFVRVVCFIGRTCCWICAAIVLAAVHLPARAQSPAIGEPEGVRSKLNRQAEYLSGHRYRRFSPELADKISAAERKSFPVLLLTDVANVIVATCGPNCDHVQISLYDHQRNLLSRSLDIRDTVIIIGNPRQSGLHDVQAAVPGCRVSECEIGLLVLRQEPSSAAGYARRASAYEGIRDYNRAIADYTEVIRLEPTAYHFLERGIAYGANGEPDRAIADESEAIRLLARPQQSDDSKYLAYAYGNRCSHHVEAGKYERAIQDCNQALSLMSYPQARTSRANAYVLKGQYQRGMQDYSETIRLLPEVNFPFSARCWGNTLAGELNAAFSDCDEAVRRSNGKYKSDDAEAFRNRGFVNLKLGQYADAIHDFDAALRLDNGEPRSLYGRGLAKLRVRDFAGGSADVAAAKAIRGNLAEEYARYGVR